MSLVTIDPLQFDGYAKLITDTFVNTVAANAGGRMVDPTFGGVGVSTSVGQ